MKAVKILTDDTESHRRSLLPTRAAIGINSSATHIWPSEIIKTSHYISDIEPYKDPIKGGNQSAVGELN